jgi:hypothetical protein
MAVGAFVSLGFDGEVRIERGFVRPEDEPHCEPSVGNATAAEHGNGHFDGGLPSNEDERNGSAALSDRLMTELTAHRTAGSRDTLGENPDVALAALSHALALRLFYGHRGTTCLEVEARHTPLERHALGITESQAERRVVNRHDRWAKRLPKDAADLWQHLLQLNAVSLGAANRIGRSGGPRHDRLLATDRRQLFRPHHQGRIFSMRSKKRFRIQAADRIAGLKKVDHSGSRRAAHRWHRLVADSECKYPKRNMRCLKRLMPWRQNSRDARDDARASHTSRYC